MILWRNISECVWRIRGNGCLEIKPTEGSSGLLMFDALRDGVPSWPWWSRRSDIKSVKVFPGVRPVSLINFFVGCVRLKTVDLSGLDTQFTLDMRAMFGGCSSLTSLDLSNFYISNVFIADFMFDGCSSLTCKFGYAQFFRSSEKKAFKGEKAWVSEL